MNKYYQNINIIISFRRYCDLFKSKPLLIMSDFLKASVSYGPNHEDEDNDSSSYFDSDTDTFGDCND